MARVVVATHGHCFDGMASAALFTALYRVLHQGDSSTFSYRACDYIPGDSAVPASWLDGDENAILDFRYSAVPALTWYFDHHATAFRDADERAVFEGGLPANGFYDAACSSCTKLIARVARERFGVVLPALDELIHWADLIDAARFPDADTAIQRRAPELQLMTVVENHGDDAFLTTIVPELLAKPLSEVASNAMVRARYAPLVHRREIILSRMRAASVMRGVVAFCDVAESPIEAVEKFGVYAIFPEARYAVVVSRTGSRARVSVGYNPWGSMSRAHDIGAICQRYGGGGHPVVGAVAFTGAELARAREVADEITGALNR